MSKKRNFWLGVVIGVLAFVVISTSLFTFALGRYNWGGPVVKAITKVIPYSAMKVNRYSYSYYDYLNDIDGLKKFIADNPDVQISREEMDKSSLQTALDSFLLEELAARYNIKLTDADYDEAMPMFLGLEEVTDEDLENFEKSLQETYGWDIETYKQKVVRLLLLSERVSAKLVTDLNIETNRIAKETMDSVLEELDAGADFATLAQTYSEDGSAAEGGDLGWFTADIMVGEFIDAIQNLEIGEYSDVFTTQYGYHIVKLTGERVNEETGATEYNASHIIIILGSDLDSYLYEARENADIKLNIHGIEIADLLN